MNVPDLPIPTGLRRVIYVVTIIGGPVVAYLAAKGYIGDLEVALWSAETAAAGTLALANTAATKPAPELGEH